MADFGGYTAPTDGGLTGRTPRIASQVQFHLAGMDKAELEKVTKLLPLTVIHDQIQRAQTILAEETLCLESTGTLTVSSNSATQPTDFYRLKLIRMPSLQWYQAQEIDVGEWDQISRLIKFAVGTQWYYRWNGTIKFYYNLADGSYDVYYYALPSTTVSTSVDPVVPAYMDNALTLFAVKELLPIAGKADRAGFYEAKYREEMERVMRSYRRSKGSIRNKVHYWDI